MIVPEEEWEWQGHAGHFIGSEKCQFRLCTVVGKVIISTIGEYRDEGIVSPIGSGRTYETMVFAAGDRKECGCVQPSSWNEIDFDGYNDPQAAANGHISMCHKWAEDNEPRQRQGE